MANNIDYYNINAYEFFEGSVDADMSYWRERFLKYIPVGGRILDAGCGSGRDSKAFIENGFSVVAFDASHEMCRLATDYLGQTVWQMRFDEMSFEDEFDGVWACASLLHVSDNEMDSVIARLRDGLAYGGTLYASFKCGEEPAPVIGDTTDTAGTELVDASTTAGAKSADASTIARGGRTFTNYTLEGLRKLFENAGFTILESDYSSDVRPGREKEQWVNVICRK